MFFFKKAITITQLHTTVADAPQRLKKQRLVQASSENHSKSAAKNEQSNFPVTFQFVYISHKRVWKEFFSKYELTPPTELTFVKAARPAVSYAALHKLILKLNRHGKKKFFSSLFVFSYNLFLWGLNLTTNSSTVSALLDNQLEFFYKNTTLLFAYKLERVPKLIKKFSRIKGPAFLSVWKYLLPTRRKMWLLHELYSTISFNAGLTLLKRYESFWVRLLRGEFKTSLQLKSTFINNYVLESLTASVGMQSKSRRIRL